MIQAIKYGMNLIGTPYGYWLGGENQECAPMFAKNGPSPNKEEITSLNCAGLVNLILRSVGKELPFVASNDKCIEYSIGGTEAYAEYYKDKAIKFNIETNYPSGSLLIRGFRNIDDQGHVAIIIEEKGKQSLILQSHVDGEFFESTTPGVNALYTLEESHNNGYYEFIVLPKDWLL
uniref:Peptidase C51 domain-containing protein n=1 Tax=viral metagenome TaxID=1070528 RepID=A0A6C0J9E8_9ZZZZ